MAISVTRKECQKKLPNRHKLLHHCCNKRNHLKIMRLNKLSRLPLLALLVGLTSVNSFGIEATTNPVGVIQVTALGNSDTLVSIPLKQPAVFNGVINQVGASTIKAEGAPGWTIDEWAVGYYAFVRSGSIAGAYGEITGNTADTITIDVGDGSILVDGPSAPDSFSIHPFLTLDTLFPNGSGVHASASPGARTSEIFIPAFDIGINNAAEATYYYHNGGWRQVGSSLSEDFGSTVLAPDSYFILRNSIATSTTVTFTGEVVMGDLTLPICLGDSSKQDNPIGLQRPIEMTLNESGLSSAFGAGDELLIWDNAVAQQNRLASTASVFTWDSVKWIKDGVDADVGNDPVLVPGNGFIVRKAAGGGLAEIDWSNVPNYGN